MKNAGKLKLTLPKHYKNKIYTLGICQNLFWSVEVVFEHGKPLIEQVFVNLEVDNVPRRFFEFPQHVYRSEHVRNTP